MELVQRLDFLLGLDQILRLIDVGNTSGRVNAILVTLGVREDGQIIVEADGIEYIPTADEIQSRSLKKEPLCPVPPDCPRKNICKDRVSQHFDVSLNTEKINFGLK